MQLPLLATRHRQTQKQDPRGAPGSLIRTAGDEKLRFVAKMEAELGNILVNRYLKNS